jgi:hypothetical protein
MELIGYVWLGRLVSAGVAYSCRCGARQKVVEAMHGYGPAYLDGCGVLRVGIDTCRRWLSTSCTSLYMGTYRDAEQRRVRSVLRFTK